MSTSDSEIKSDPHKPSAELLRKRLRIALSAARTEAGLTQKAAASKLDWSQSKLTRIESGAVPVTPNDVRGMLQVYDVDDATEVSRILQLAKDAREAKSLSAFDSILDGDFGEMVAQEPFASRISKFEPTLVSGYFQTTEYARALLTALKYTEDDVALRTELRLKRQLLLESNRVPQIDVVMGELILRRTVGDRSIMRGQLKHLLELNQRDDINLRVLPFEAGPHAGMGEPFTVMQFDDLELDDAVFLRDALKRTSAAEDQGLIDHYLTLHTSLIDLAEQHGDFEDHVERALRDLGEGA